MPHYDFKNLSPLDYEDLSRDLLQQESGITFESFKPGKDGGIDLRHLKTKNHSIIVQCKRYYDYKALISTLKKELNKVIKINPSRYIICTSIELSPSNKDYILNLFNPYILNANDIYGQNDFNNLLGKFPEIEKKHYKLWLSSTNILENIIHSKIHNQSIFENEIIQETVKTYVSNDSMENAIKIINKNKYAVISGIPGIGKSTLAKMLCYHYIKNHDFEEFVYVTESIGEAISTYKESKRQIFLFDDFLGSNFLEDNLTHNEGKNILSFINRINKSKNKILILTTREYILNQARQKFETIDSHQIQIAKCIIDLSQYTKSIRAKILYNHIFFSNLPPAYINNILKNKNYIKIINHKNYNPRVIEVITSNNRWATIKEDEFAKKFIEFLDYPESIWEHVYENQISELSKAILAVLMSTGTPILISHLERATNEYSKYNQSINNYAYNSINFKKSIKALENTFIITNTDNSGNQVIEYQNPSVQDFLIKYLSRHEYTISALINSFTYFNQLFYIFIYNQDLNESNNINAIQISKEQNNERLNIIINKLHEPVVSSLYKVHYTGIKSFQWRLVESDKLQILNQIISHYPVEQYEEINDYIFKQLKLIINNTSSITLNNYKYLSLIHNKFKEKIFLDKESIITELARSLSYIDEINDFLDISKIDLSEFINAINNNDIISWIEEIIDEDMPNNHPDEVEDTIEKFKLTINKIYSYSTNKIETFMNKLEEHRLTYDNDNFFDNSSFNKGVSNLESSDIYIDDMFNSLKN